MLLGVPLRILNRILGWIVAKDCTCGEKTAPDAFHRNDCSHPLIRRSRADTEPFTPVQASLTVYTSKGVRKRRRAG